MTEHVDESKLLKPGDLKYKTDFWFAVETGELAKAIAYSLRAEDSPKDVHIKAVQELFRFVNFLKTPSGEKPYNPSRKDIESFTKKFEKYFNEFHYLERVNAFIRKLDLTQTDEAKFDKLNKYLWNVFFEVADESVEETFKQWMVNEKRLLSGMQIHYPVLFGLWSPAGGNGKSFLLECLARALSDGKLFVLSQWSDLESTSGSYLKDVFGVLYKDEIGTTRGIKDTIKSLITSSEVTVQCKYKEPIKLPKRFQLVCSANKPIGARLFEDESGYQRRDGTHECYGRLFDVESKDDLIKYFRKMFEFAPLEYKMEGMSARKFEFDEETIWLIEKLASSDMMVKTSEANASKAVKIQSFSTICNEILGISKENEPKKYYKLEALLEKSGCFERIKYSNVSTRYFRVLPDKLYEALKNISMKTKLPCSFKEYVKPTVKKNFEKMYEEALAYVGQEQTDHKPSAVTRDMLVRITDAIQEINRSKKTEDTISEIVDSVLPEDENVLENL